MPHEYLNFIVTETLGRSYNLHNLQRCGPVILQCTWPQSIAFQGIKEADVQFFLHYEKISEQISE